MNNNVNNTTREDILLAISKSPFRVAFMATLGVGLAQLTMLLGFLGVVTGVGTLIYLLVK